MIEKKERERIDLAEGPRSRKISKKSERAQPYSVLDEHTKVLNVPL